VTEEVEYLTLEDLFVLTRELDAGPVRDPGLLDSAAARPRSRSSVFGEDAYQSIEFKAAAWLHSIAGNHALVDGNTRLAWHAATVFLFINGRRVTISRDEAFALVMSVAAGEIDVPEIAARLRVSDE